MPDSSAEKLKLAAEELNAMTPDTYLELMDYVERLERNLPEMPSRVTVKTFSPGGFDTMFTLLDVDDDILYERLLPFMKKNQERRLRPRTDLCSTQVC